MPATPTQLKAILLAEIRAAGDARSRVQADAILAQVFDAIWDTYSAEGLRNPRLQYLYAKRQVIEFSVGHRLGRRPVHAGHARMRHDLADRRLGDPLSCPSCVLYRASVESGRPRRQKTPP